MTATPVRDDRATTPELDRYLDGAMAAFLRHGVSRTRVPDIAHEAGASRTTVYRVLGSVERVALALLERELGRMLDQVTTAFRSAQDWNEVLDVCALAMEAVEGHQLLRKVRDDEPAIIGVALVKHTPMIIGSVSSVLEPSLAELAGRGVTSGRQHQHLAETLVRLGITCALAPPASGVRALLHDILGERPEGVQ